MDITIHENNIFSAKNIKIKPILVRNHRLLKELLPFLQSKKLLAIDIESSMPKRYGKKISLIQIGTQTKQLLIDTEKIFPDELIGIFEDPGIEKIFFDCAQDVMMLKETLDCAIRNVSDVSQYYSILHNHTNNTGLDKVINEFYGEIIDRDNKRKWQKLDWSIRPLPRKAIEYAASDVAYLIPIRNYLVEEFVSKGQNGNLERLKKSYELINPPNDYLSKIFFEFKVANRYNDPLSKLLALRLHRFRDKIAQKRNRPFYFVLGNEKLTNLIDQKPDNLIKTRDLLPRKIAQDEKFVASIYFIIQQTVKDYTNNEILFTYEYKRYKDALTKISYKNLDVLTKQEYCLAVLGNADLYIKMNRILSILKKWRDIKAKQLDLQVDMFLSAFTLKKLAKSLAKGSNGNIYGVGTGFWSEYSEEILFWTSNINVRINKPKNSPQVSNE